MHSEYSEKSPRVSTYVYLVIHKLLLTDKFTVVKYLYLPKNDNSESK